MQDYLKAAKITLVCVVVGGLTLPAVWAVGSGLVAICSAGIGHLARKAATSQAEKDLPDDIKKKAAGQQSEAERRKALSERGYKHAEQGNREGFDQPRRVNGR